jgi:hypothetical protein
VQESGSFQTTQKVPKKFLGKIGFLKPCAQTCPRNPSDFFVQGAQEIRFFWKNRLSQTVCPNVPKKSDSWEKSDFSNRVQGAQEIRFFWKNRISQTVSKVPKKSDFFGKIGFLKPPKVPKKSDFLDLTRIYFE